VQQFIQALLGLELNIDFPLVVLYVSKGLQVDDKLLEQLNVVRALEGGQQLHGLLLVVYQLAYLVLVYLLFLAETTAPLQEIGRGSHAHLLAAGSPFVHALELGLVEQHGSP
jgi:high-affinity Fe2+/Pb2+ permease